MGVVVVVVCCRLFFFFFNDTATTEIYTLSLHDAFRSYCPNAGLHLYEDPQHCSMYWECYNGCLSHMTCQGNQLYDSEHGWCLPPENICCGNRDCDGRACSQDCDFKCPSDYGFYEDPDNCMKFYQCDDGIAYHKSCGKINGEQLMFRQSDAQCDWDHRVDCGNRPICDENDQNCLDPTTQGTTDKSTTSQGQNICQNIPCDHGDGFYPETPCAHCFCERSESTRLNSSHITISYAVFCLKKKKKNIKRPFISSKITTLPYFFIT